MFFFKSGFNSLNNFFSWGDYFTKKIAFDIVNIVYLYCFALPAMHIIKKLGSVTVVGRNCRLKQQENPS